MTPLYMNKHFLHFRSTFPYHLVNNDYQHKQLQKTLIFTIYYNFLEFFPSRKSQMTKLTFRCDGINLESLFIFILLPSDISSL